LRAGPRQDALVFSNADRTDAAFLQPEEFGETESPEHERERKQQSHGRKQAYRNLRIWAHGSSPHVHAQDDSTFVLRPSQDIDQFDATAERPA
jgi:hypothetical protein